MRNMANLQQKIDNARRRTKAWALGVNEIDFPDESCRIEVIEAIEAEITNGGWGGKRIKGVKCYAD